MASFDQKGITIYMIQLCGRYLQDKKPLIMLAKVTKTLDHKGSDRQKELGIAFSKHSTTQHG